MSSAAEPLADSNQSEAQSASELSTRYNSVRDPLAQVLALGERDVRFGIWLGLFGALLCHGIIGMRAARALGDMDDFAKAVHVFVRDKMKTQFDIDLSEPEPPPPPPPEPEPEAPPPEPEPPKAEPVAKPVPDEPPPPPAAAQAGKVLTEEPNPDEPVDLTDNTIVTGTSERYAGGTTASTGTSDTAVRDARARADGVGKYAPPGPTKTGAPVKDLSRAARPVATGNWNDCGFPPEADMEGIDHAVVTLSVTVGPDGRAKSVAVLKDPGNGFGRLVRQCAMRKRYEIGLDRLGNPASTSTPPFTVRFTR